MDYHRITELGNKIRYGTANKAEKDEYMLLLYQSNSINKQQFDNYTKNNNAEDILKGALAIGAVILVGYLLSEAFSKK